MQKKPSPPARNPASTPNNQQQGQTVTYQQWQGALPPPGALEHFNRIIPNGAERIMAMVEQEQAHRIKHEERRLEAAIAEGRVRGWQGFALSIACVLGAVGTAAIGAHPSVSIALVSLPMVAAIKALLGRK